MCFRKIPQINLEKWPEKKDKASNTMYLVPPFTFHQLKMGLRSVCISKIQEHNNVTDKYFLKDCFGKKNITIVHNTLRLLF